jgi:hypothetical protein
MDLGRKTTFGNEEQAQRRKEEGGRRWWREVATVVHRGAGRRVLERRVAAGTG